MVDEDPAERKPEDLSVLVEMWKTTVEVQQHFNDLEWKIRGLALTVLTGALGAGALALREGSTLLIGSWRFSLASLVLVAGLLVWLAFFFVDSVWYHRLLVGSVKEGMRIEKVIQAVVPGAGKLTEAIGDASAWSIRSQDSKNDVWQRKDVEKRERKKASRGTPRPRITLRSKHKLIVFYTGIGVLLLALALAAHVAANSVVPDKADTTTTTSAPSTTTAPSTTAPTA